MNEHPITCRELVEQVTDYLEYQLSEDERLRFEEHLAECGACARYVEQIREMIDAVGALRHSPAELIDEQARNRLIQVFRIWQREQAH